jgi:hypothetical protein
MTHDLRLLTERVTLRIGLLSFFVIVIGLIIMWISLPVAHAGYHKTSTLLEESGAALFISGILAVLWELAGKRAFADEILAKANMSRDLAEAGIDIAAYSFKDKRIDWDELFKSTCKLDIFIAYGHTWRNTQSEQINTLLSDADAKLRIILPDSENEELMKSLSRRFEMEPEALKLEIGDAVKFFERRKKKAKGSIEIYLTSVMPLFSFYRFNSKVVFALYNHRAGQHAVPTFICDKDGFLFKFLSDEFEGIIGDPRTKRLETEQSGSERG